MRKQKLKTTAKQIVAWLGEGRTNAGILATRIEKNLERSKSPTANRRLSFEDVMDQVRRKPKRNLVREYMKKQGAEMPNPPKSASEFMERQEQREIERKRRLRRTNSWGCRVGRQIAEAVEKLEADGLI